ncbi:MAG: pyroglutamyl-peptidase I [Pirellulaceae bacterium]
MRILLTAFEAYDDWKENSSWLALVELLKATPEEIDLVTRLYPVDLHAMQERLVTDLQSEFDAVLHLGQSPGLSSIKLEKIALNVAGCIDDQGEELPQLIQDGPTAFRSQMPLGNWAALLRENEIPAKVSYHAGTFLCNATMYLSHYYSSELDKPPPVGFIHLPLTTEQVARANSTSASLPTTVLAKSIRMLLTELAAAPTDE